MSNKVENIKAKLKQNNTKSFYHINVKRFNQNNMKNFLNRTSTDYFPLSRPFAINNTNEDLCGEINSNEKHGKRLHCHPVLECNVFFNNFFYTIFII